MNTQLIDSQAVKLLSNEIKEPQNATSSTASVSGEYQKLQEFQLQKQSLLKWINHLSELINGGIKESLLPVTFRDEIQAIKDKLESQHFRVAVIGDFSQGKSTLINALLGEEIQPVRAIPCSGTLSVLKYGNRKRVVCRYRDGNEQEIAVEDYQKKAAISKEAALNNRSEELGKSNIAEIIFEHPNLLLCRNGVEIVDSPGLNEHPDRTRVTEELLKEADAILFMTNANKLLTQGERDIITRIKEREGDRPLENLFLVVNFMDNLDSDEDREDVQIAANSIINDGSITGKDRIHFISAKSALKATLSNTSNDYLVSFKNFTRALETFLTDERGFLILQNASKNLAELTQDCINDLNIAISNVDTELSSSDKLEILEQIGEASGRLITIRKIIGNLKELTIQLALKSWNEYKQDLKSQVLERSKKWKTTHNLIFSRDALIQDCCSQFISTLQPRSNLWVSLQMNNVIFSPKLALLDRAVKDEFDALKVNSAYLEEKIGTNFSGNFQPTFHDFDINFIADFADAFKVSGGTFASVSGFAAAGVGVGGGATAVTLFLIPALVIKPAIILDVIGAVLLGGGFGAFAMAGAYKQISEQVCKLGFEEFDKAEESIKEKIEESINAQFLSRADSAGKLIKQIISELENRLELEERKQQEEGDRLRSLISSKKQEFETTLRK